jgi:uncharacterized membrane protein YciS (DUF1049 family)
MGEFAYTAVVFGIGFVVGMIALGAAMIACEVRETRKRLRP